MPVSLHCPIILYHVKSSRRQTHLFFTWGILWHWCTSLWCHVFGSLPHTPYWSLWCYPSLSFIVPEEKYFDRSQDVPMALSVDPFVVSSWTLMTNEEVLFYRKVNSCPTLLVGPNLIIYIQERHGKIRKLTSRDLSSSFTISEIFQWYSLFVLSVWTTECGY